MLVILLKRFLKKIIIRCVCVVRIALFLHLLCFLYYREDFNLLIVTFRKTERPSGNAWIIAVGVSAGIIILVIIAGCVWYKISNRKAERNPDYDTTTTSGTLTR